MSKFCQSRFFILFSKVLNPAAVLRLNLPPCSTGRAWTTAYLPWQVVSKTALFLFKDHEKIFSRCVQPALSYQRHKRSALISVTFSRWITWSQRSRFHLHILHFSPGVSACFLFYFSWCVASIMAHLVEASSLNFCFDKMDLMWSLL